MCGKCLPSSGALSSALISLTLTGFLAFLTGLVIVRLSGIGATIVTIAILVIVHSIFMHRTDIFKGKQAFFGIPQVFDLSSIIMISIFVTLFRILPCTIS